MDEKKAKPREKPTMVSVGRPSKEPKEGLLPWAALSRTLRPCDIPSSSAMRLSSLCKSPYPFSSSGSTPPSYISGNIELVYRSSASPEHVFVLGLHSL